MEIIEITNQENIRTLNEKENYNFPGILEVAANKQRDMKEKYEIIT